MLVNSKGLFETDYEEALLYRLVSMNAEIHTCRRFEIQSS